MKQNIAVIGYGNLGKNLEKELQNDSDLRLIAIYSRRNLDNDKWRPLNDISKFADADVYLNALGSLNDIIPYAEKLKEFDTVDSYDVHAEIDGYKALLQKIKPDNLSIISVGWDPGLLSMIRGIAAIGSSKPSTLWGEGISQGHSNALRGIEGVLDAVQFTVPKDNAASLAINNEPPYKLHKRVCYVSCVEKDKTTIEKIIRNMPNYFKDYEVEIHFCSTQEVRRMKQKVSHKGRVLASGDGYGWDCSVNIQNNAEFTAKIMIAYAKAIPQLKKDGYKGPLDPYDIPLKYIANRSLI